MYCDSPGDAAALESAAAGDGWRVARVVEGEGIVATRADLAVTPETVPRVRAFFERLAASVPGGEYDGWEAAA